MYCEICDGPLLAMGQPLGTLYHFRCRDCGAEHSFPKDDVPEEIREAISEAF